MNGQPNYQRQFWMLAARSLPHHTLLVFSKRLRAGSIASLLSSSPEKRLHKSAIQTYSQADVDTYRATAAHAKLWHGTGRFQYAGEKVVDTFGAILKASSLNPAKDAYAVFIGGEEMTSISTTPLRIIARSYADTHGKGEKEPHRYGSGFWWVGYYYSIFYGEVFTKYSSLVIRNWSKWRTATADQSGQRLWGKKVRKDAYSVWDVFGSGSDIPDNFPILFGIARHEKPLTLPKVMAKSEVRLSGAVRITDLSHLEVPEEKVAEVRSLLKESGYELPVFPIELGEYAASQQPFVSLLGISDARKRL